MSHHIRSCPQGNIFFGMQIDKTVKGLEIQHLDGSNLKILIIHTKWNSKVVDALVQGCVNSLLLHKVDKANITIKTVSGAFELPFAVQKFAINYDAVIPIGVLIKGSTMHFEYIAEATANGLMRVGLDTKIPVIFGVLTCLNEQQALARAGLGSDSHNHGIDWAYTAVEMALLS